MNDYVNNINLGVLCTGAFVTIGLILSFLWGLVRTLSLRGAVDSFKETIKPSLFIMFVLFYFCSLFCCFCNFGQYPTFGLIHWIISMLGLVRITPME